MSERIAQLNLNELLNAKFISIIIPYFSLRQTFCEKNALLINSLIMMKDYVIVSKEKNITLKRRGK